MCTHIVVNTRYIFRRTGERFQLGKVSFGVTQGHWYWCHSISTYDFVLVLHYKYQVYVCLYVVCFSRYYHLFTNNYRCHVTLTHLFVIDY